MTDAELLTKVKKALGITGTYQDDALTEYISEVKSFLIDAGVSSEYITSGIVSRGVTDLWNYGAGDGRLSEYFIQRAAQLSYKG
jgi:hypothetical protein